jgi:hypothetical protein
MLRRRRKSDSSLFVSQYGLKSLSNRATNLRHCRDFANEALSPTKWVGKTCTSEQDSTKLHCSISDMESSDVDSQTRLA